MLLNPRWSALVITLLLTVAVMLMGVYTLSKVKPFSDNIQGLENSVQARYHARSGEEIAKLIYYHDLNNAQRILWEWDDGMPYDQLSDAQKAKAFCRTDGDVLQNNKRLRATQACLDYETHPHTTHKPQSSDRSNIHEPAQAHEWTTSLQAFCEEKGWKDFVPASQINDLEGQSIEFSYGCDELTSKTNPIFDPTGGVDTEIMSKTVRIPQSCQGNSDLQYSRDGDCQNWNKLVLGQPVRINLSNLNGLELERSFGENNSFTLRFRLPNIKNSENEELLITAQTNKDPMVLWNIYNDEVAFFPALEDSAIPRSEIYSENLENNGKVEWDQGDGISLWSSVYKGVWDQGTICAEAESGLSSSAVFTQAQAEAQPNLALAKDLITYEDGSCRMSLRSFFHYGMGSCQYQQCFLELSLIGSLELSDPNEAGIEHPDKISVPYLEYQIEFGNEGGTSGGDPLQGTDTRPVITSVWESGGYSVRDIIVIEDEQLIPSASSPIGR